MGVIHHASYLAYLEEARVAYLRSLGHPYDAVRAGEGSGAGSAPASGREFPVLEVVVRYRRPLRFDEEVEVLLAIGALSGATFEIAYLLNVGAETRASAVTVHGCVDRRGRPARLPEWLRSLGAPSGPPSGPRPG